MRALQEVVLDELTLRKPSWKSGLHELRAGDELLGTLDISTWSGGSAVRSAAGSWRFERPHGLLRRRVRVLSDPGEQELGLFTSRGGRGGALQLGSRDYELRASGLFKPTWTWSAADRELASFTAGGSLGETKGTFFLADAARQCADGTLLLLLGAHMALLSQRDTAMTAGATAAAASVASS